MAAMTVTDYSARMTHAIGGAAPATGVTVISVLNEAIKELFDCHDWTWRQRPPTTLNLTISQSYVALPTDFGWDGQLWIQPTTALTAGIFKCGLDDIARFRSRATPASTPYYVALAWPSQTSVSVAPGVPRLEIWPTPAASISGAFYITYKAGPIDVTTSTDVPNIPSSFESALTLLACGLLKRYEMDGESTTYNQALERIAQLKAADNVIRKAQIIAPASEGPR